VLDDQPGIGEIDVVGQFAGKPHFVGDEDAGHALLRQIADGDQNLLHRLGSRAAVTSSNSITSTRTLILCEHWSTAGKSSWSAAASMSRFSQLLPERDRVEQIRLMSDELQRLFGVRPTGLWDD